MAQRVQLNVNGKPRSVQAEADMPLRYALRNDVCMREWRLGCGLAHDRGQAVAPELLK